MEIEQIFELFSDLVSGKKPNGKFQLARIYGAYEREQERIAKNKAIDEAIGDNRRRYTIHRISDDMAIVQYHDDIFKNGIREWYCPAYNDRVSNNVYDSFDKALIAVVAMKNNSIEASEYIFKMLDMTILCDISKTVEAIKKLPTRTIEIYSNGYPEEKDFISLCDAIITVESGGGRK